jgi:membrane protease YdiL (CAAX protease family)
LKTWPVIFLITVAFSFLTQCAAKLFGIELPEQSNLELVRNLCGWNLTFASIVFQIVILMPILEEIIFRLALFKLTLAAATKFYKENFKITLITVAFLSATIFSFAHYIDYTTWIKTTIFSLRQLDNAFIALVFFGMAQCWLYRKASSIYAPMLNHMLFNLTNLILLFIFKSA